MISSPDCQPEAGLNNLVLSVTFLEGRSALADRIR